MESFQVLIYDIQNKSEIVLLRTDSILDAIYRFKDTTIDLNDFLDYYIELRRIVNGVVTIWEMNDDRVKEFSHIPFIVK